MIIFICANWNWCKRMNTNINIFKLLNLTHGTINNNTRPVIICGKLCKLCIN